LKTEEGLKTDITEYAKSLNLDVKSFETYNVNYDGCIITYSNSRDNISYILDSEGNFN